MATTRTTKNAFPYYQKATYHDARYPNSKTVTTLTSGMYPYGNTVRTLQDDPAWKQKIARGVDATNAYSLRKRLVTPYVSFNTDSSYAYGNTTIGEGFLRWSPAALDTYDLPADLALRDLALTRFKRKITSNLGQKNLLVPTAELKDLRGMIKQTAYHGVEAVKSLIALRKGNFQPITRQIADTWLYFSFAVNPMLKDIAEIVRAIDDYLDREDHTVRLASGAEKSWVSTLKVPSTNNTIHTSITSSYEIVHNLSYKYTGGFDFKVLSSNNYGVVETFSLEVEKLPALFWELTAFSWMFDYFTNIGEYLDDTFVLPPGSSKYMTLSTRYTATARVTPILVKNNPTYKILSHTFTPGFDQLVVFNRERLGALPRVGLHLKSVDQVGKNAVNKLLNLASILVKDVPRGALDLGKLRRISKYQTQ